MTCPTYTLALIEAYHAAKAAGFTATAEAFKAEILRTQ